LFWGYLLLSAKSCAHRVFKALEMGESTLPKVKA